MLFSADRLLEAYKDLWENRTLESDLSAENTLKNAVERELRDELTHPRLRKSPAEKFYFAVERIVHSSLDKEEKVQLIHFYSAIHLDIISET